MDRAEHDRLLDLQCRQQGVLLYGRLTEQQKQCLVYGLLPMQPVLEVVAHLVSQFDIIDDRSPSASERALIAASVFRGVMSAARADGVVSVV